MVDKRKREIRAVMAETGLKYTEAARELDRRRAADAPTETEPVPPADAEG